MNKPRSIARSKSDDTGRTIQSRIARYIRGEISAKMICTNGSKVDVSARATNAISTGGVATSRQGGLLASKLRSKIRPPFRNNVNTKNTNFSLLSVVNDMKGMSLAASAKEAAIIIPDIDTICLCQSEAIRKFVPEPGSYMLKLTQKLTALRDRNASAASA